MDGFRVSCVFGVVGWVSLAAPSAFAERAIVMPTTVSGYMMDKQGWLKEYDKQLRSVLERSRMEIVRDKLQSDELLCHAPNCLAAITKQHDADIVVGATVANDEGRPPTYHAHVWLYYRSHPAEFKSDLERPCPHCSELEVSTLLSNMLNEAFEPPKPPPVEPPKKDGKKPPGDGNPIDGHNGHPPPESNTPRILQGVGAGLLVLGAVGIIVGAVELSLDGQGSCEKAPGWEFCPRRYTTAGAGGTLVGLGVAGLVAGGVMVGVGTYQHSKAAKLRVGIKVAPNAALMQAGGEF